MMVNIIAIGISVIVLTLNPNPYRQHRQTAVQYQLTHKDTRQMFLVLKNTPSLNGQYLKSVQLNTVPEYLKNVNNIKEDSPTKEKILKKDKERSLKLPKTEKENTIQKENEIRSNPQQSEQLIDEIEEDEWLYADTFLADGEESKLIKYKKMPKKLQIELPPTNLSSFPNYNNFISIIKTNDDIRETIESFYNNHKVIENFKFTSPFIRYIQDTLPNRQDIIIILNNINKNNEMYNFFKELVEHHRGKYLLSEIARMFLLDASTLIFQLKKELGDDYGSFLKT